jgi:hypothetical protein
MANFQPFFFLSFGSWIFIAVAGQCPMIRFTGKGGERDTRRYRKNGTDKGWGTNRTRATRMYIVLLKKGRGTPRKPGQDRGGKISNRVKEVASGLYEIEQGQDSHRG